MVEYKQTKAAQDKLRQRANRKHWNTFRAQFSLPELASYPSTYNLTVEQAQAEAVALGTVQTVAQPVSIQSAIPMSIAKVSAKPRKRKQVSDDDDEEEEEEEGDADFNPMMAISPKKEVKRKPASKRTISSGGVSKKRKVITGREEKAGLPEAKSQMNEEASTDHQYAMSSKYQPTQNGKNKHAMAPQSLMSKKDPMVKINMVAGLIRSAEEWEIAEIIQGIIDNPDHRKIVSRLMHHKFEDMREAAHESRNYEIKRTTRGKKAPKPRLQEELSMDQPHDEQSNSGWKVERSGMGRLFDAIDKRAAAEAEKAQHFRDMYENAVYGVE